MKIFLVPAYMFLASCLMSLAWLGHLRYRDSIGFWTALALSWLLVLPEYALNVAATRYGYGTYSGAQMATFHLAFGVVCVALVSRHVLGEPLTLRQILGFALLAAGIILVVGTPQGAHETHASPEAASHRPSEPAGRSASWVEGA